MKDEDGGDKGSSVRDRNLEQPIALPVPRADSSLPGLPPARPF